MQLHLQTFDFNLLRSLIKVYRRANNACILAETGSGKTLAYLLPVLNRIYATKEKLENDKINISKAGNSKQIQSGLNPPRMLKRLSLRPQVSKSSRGALIMTSNGHLMSQIEILINDIDFKKMLNISVDDGTSTLPTNYSAYDIVLSTPSKCKYLSE